MDNVCETKGPRASLPADAPPFGLEGCVAEARVVDCYDGDTLKLVMPVPWAGGALRKVTARLLGVDTPEVRGESKPRGEAAHAFVLRWLAPSFDGGRPKEFFQGVHAVVRVECFGNDKYGRVLARVHRDDECLNDVLVRMGFVY